MGRWAPAADSGTVWCWRRDGLATGSGHGSDLDVRFDVSWGMGCSTVAATSAVDLVIEQATAADLDAQLGASERGTRSLTHEVRAYNEARRSLPERTSTLRDGPWGMTGAPRRTKSE